MGTSPPPDASTGLAFHRLGYLRARSGWWTPFAVGAVGAGFYAIGVLALAVAVLIVGSVIPAAAEASSLVGAGVFFDPDNPLVLALGLGTIALLLPAYILASRTVQGRGVGYLSSVVGRLRWGWLLGCVGIALAVNGGMSVLAVLVLPAPETEVPDSTVLSPALLITGLLVVVVVVPLQAAAEEYVFRGYLMQSIGRWLRHPVFAIVAPVPLFVVAHGYDPVGQASVGIFAVVAGWLAWRTGGLEASIGVHVVNNVAALVLGLFGLADPNETAVGWESLVFSVVFLAAYAAVVEVIFRVRRCARETTVRPDAGVMPDGIDRPSPAQEESAA